MLADWNPNKSVPAEGTSDIQLIPVVFSLIFIITMTKKTLTR